MLMKNQFDGCLMEFDDSINIQHFLDFGVGISLICNVRLFQIQVSDDKQQESISECQAFNSKVWGNGGRKCELNRLAKEVDVDTMAWNLMCFLVVFL